MDDSAEGVTNMDDPMQHESKRQPSHKFRNGLRYFLVSARAVSTPA